MKHILKYIFSIGLMVSFQLATAQTKDSIITPLKFDTSFSNSTQKTDQNKTVETKQKDTVKPAKIDRYGLRAGIDLYRLGRSLFDKNYKGTEIVGDLRLTKKYYLAGEFGHEEKNTAESMVNYSTNGNYFKLGVDYNTYENWVGMENMITLGLRYGVSSFSQTLNSYEVYNPDHYFQEETTAISGQKYSGLSAHWLEFVAGVKTKVFNNFFLGFSLRLNHLVHNEKPENFDNLYIPGFNKTYSGNFGVGFNYTATYFIPVFKKKEQPKK